MSGIGSEFFSGAVQEVAGIMINSIFSLISSNYKMHEARDHTLVSMEKVLIGHQCAIKAARERRITDQELLDWLARLINDVYLGQYTQCTFLGRKSLCGTIACEGPSNSSLSTNRPAKRMRTMKTLLFGDAELKELHNVLGCLRGNDLDLFTKLVLDQPKISRPLRTYLFMDHSRLFGRGQERQAVMDFLLNPNLTGPGNVDILPIVGHHGVGKTALALHCYHDRHVQSHFSLKIYLECFYVSFYITINKILRQCGREKITHDDYNTAAAMLKQTLSSERFLVIVDDVHILDFMKWKVFWECLKCGKEGSKVILVTNFHSYNIWREEVNIERVMPIMLNFFPEEEYLWFLKEHAFGTANPEDFPELAKIAREIAEKLNGTIGGAMVFGELLRDNLNARFWRKVRDCIRTGVKDHDLVEPWPLMAVAESMIRLLPVRLKMSTIGGRCGGFEVPLSEDIFLSGIPSFRELNALIPKQYCRGVIKKKLRFVVTTNVFLSKSTFTFVEAVPFAEGPDLHLT